MYRNKAVADLQFNGKKANLYYRNARNEGKYKTMKQLEV